MVHPVLRVFTAAIFAASFANSAEVHDQAHTETRTPLAFEVTTVKPSDPNARGGGIRPMPGGQTYVATGVPLRLMIKLMYGITDVQIAGGPDWINTERYDVHAKAEKPSNIDQLHQMFQTLLADRFQLKFHRETRTLPVFALILDKPGKLKLNESTPEFADFPIKGRGPWQSRGYAPPGFVPGPGEDPPPGANGPTIFTALREQLGLKLESQKGPVEVFVIDSAEKPKEN